MPHPEPAIPLDSFVTFGDLLKYARRRARLTQREVAIAVGYSEAQISRLEQNLRPPDLAVLTAQFIPALYLEDEPDIVARLLDLAAQARGEEVPRNGVITFSKSIRREVRESSQTVEEEVRHNLPFALTSFIGRDYEIAGIKKILEDKARLITLTGSGGSGKTRLALQVAHQLVDAYRNGVWLIELAPIANPANVTQTFITTLGMPDPRDGSFINTINKFLRAKNTLLIVDNCEHLVDEVARLLNEILSHCPHIQVITTTREALNMAGEVRFGVPPLLESESIQLFSDRAKHALPSFELTDENASRIAHICARLDGIPLAIELAAARMSALGLDEIASLLDDRFHLLTTGNRAALPRQQTLFAAVDWSFDLLAEEERQLFRALSVFAGGFDLDAARAVLGESVDVLDTITRFVDKSLLTVDRPTPTESRYRMLETIREYCLSKLRQADEESPVRERHLHYFLSYAEEGDVKLRGREQRQWIMRLEREHENMRAALTFALENGSARSAEMGLRLTHALNYFWFTRGYLEERGNWVRNLTSLPHQPHHTAEYARALGMLANWTGDSNESHRLLEESLSLSGALKDKSAIAAIHLNAAMFNWMEDDPSVGRTHFEKCIALYRELGERWRLSRALVELGEYAQVRQDDRTTARKCFEECLQIARELEDARNIAFALIRLGDLVIEQNKIAEAKQYCSEGLALAAELNDVETMAWGINDLGVVAMCEGDLAEAERLCAESLKLSRDWANHWQTIIRRYWLARVVVYQGDEERAAALFEENVRESESSSFDWGRAASIQGLGDIALRRGDLELAKSLHSDGMLALHKGHYGYSLAYSLDSFAALACATSQYERALILFSAADAYREAIQTGLLPPEQKEREELLAAIHRALPPNKRTSLIDQGRGMSHDEAVEFALN